MIQENRRTGIWREYEEHVASYYRVARYTDCDENNMIVLAVELKRIRVLKELEVCKETLFPEFLMKIILKLLSLLFIRKMNQIGDCLL